MVKSGLDVDPSQKKEIRVSPYRLATHLGMAFTTYTLLIWTGLDLLNTSQKAAKVASNMSQSFLTHSKHLRRFAIINGALVATTVISGAYVAGNDAGRAYNTFPKMNDDWIPPEIFEMTPLWRNFVENTATVQFDHRVLALTTLTSISAMYAQARGLLSTSSAALASTITAKDVWNLLPRYSRLAFNAVAGMSIVQVSLGIGTLLV
jgi:cytochrome c oxidase assembly protein subunit 15